MKPTDRTGEKYGKLTCMSYVKSRNWLCLCECGNTTIVHVSNLRNGHVLSCGCYRKERASKLNPKLTVSEYNSTEYLAWRNMMVRCYRSTSPNYKWYGERGISVCERWHKFENFFMDMGEKPDPKLTLERIDVNGNYEPSNCKWATMKEQQNNRRNTGKNRVVMAA
jgi:hypothetical protein